MALLERVATLLRANVNDLLDRSENPPVMLKQLLRDMENQLLQVKTQVAIAVADQHVLETRYAEHVESAAGWRRKAELALARNDEPLARAAAERCLQAEQLVEGYGKQLADQRMEAELMRQQYRQLEAKLAETQAQGELLLAAHRRGSRRAPPPASPEAERILQRMRESVLHAEATRVAEQATGLDLAGSVERRLQQMERNDRVDALLEELKGRQRALEG